MHVPIRWGIIGCGDVTEIKSGPAFNKVADSKLVAVMRRDGAKAADYARRHNVPKWYDNADALIADPDVDAVYIATPPGNHEEYALRVAAAGKPCYVEKPMARNHAECQRMVDAFAQKNLPLFVAYYRRGLPRFVKTRELINAGEIGELIAIEYTLASNQCATRQDPPPWRVVPSVSGGGIFLDLASHLLDLFDFLFGPLTFAWSDAKRFGPGSVEDYVVLNFTTPAGVRGVGEWDFTSDEHQDHILIEGTRGKIELSCFGNEPVIFETAERRQELSLPNPPHVQQPLIESMVNDLLGRGKCPSTGLSAARTSALMDQALLPYYGSRGDGFWKNFPAQV